MTAEAIFEKGIRYDRLGKPLEVVIPYEEFVDFIETYGLDLTGEEKEAINEAKADLAAGKSRNFVSAEDAKRELGL